jgi:uncharacterized protein (AIM24 family)
MLDSYHAGGGGGGGYYGLSSGSGSNTPTVTSMRDPGPGVPLLSGFELWIAPTPNVYAADGMPVYEILGTDAQIVQFPVRAGRQIMCFSGAMAYMSDGLQMECKLAGLGKAFGRLAGGGSLFQITYTNNSSQDGYIGMTPDYPGYVAIMSFVFLRFGLFFMPPSILTFVLITNCSFSMALCFPSVIVPINMHACPAGKIIALRDSFLCSTVGLGGETTDVGAGFNPANSVGAFCCSGVDWIVQTVSNGEWAFLMAMGTVLVKPLGAGESLIVDGDSILCFESSVTVDIQVVGNLMVCCCAGEGVFNTVLTGPGKIWIQSLSIDKMRRLFPPKVQSSGGPAGDSGGSDGS